MEIQVHKILRARLRMFQRINSVFPRDEKQESLFGWRFFNVPKSHSMERFTEHRLVGLRFSKQNIFPFLGRTRRNEYFLSLRKAKVHFLYKKGKQHDIWSLHSMAYISSSLSSFSAKGFLIPSIGNIRVIISALPISLILSINIFSHRYWPM